MVATKNGFRTAEGSYEAIVGKHAPEETDPERVRSAGIAAERTADFIKRGWKRRPWTATTPGSPCVKRHRGFNGGSYLDFDWGATEEWFDHWYRLVMPGGTVFVSEPYDIGPKGMANLAALEDQGWDVMVRAANALHFPGRTVAVWIYRKGQKPWQMAA